MARTFDGSTTNLTLPVPLVTSVPITFSAWVNAASFPGTMRVFNISSLSGSDGFTVYINGTGAVIAGSKSAGTEVDATTTSSLVVGNWMHIAAVFRSPTSRSVYLNGVNYKNTNSTSNTPVAANLTEIAIGSQVVSLTQVFNGLIALPAIWNAALTDSNILYLAGGVSPQSILNANLVSYNLLAGQSPEPDQISALRWTLTGNPVYAADPPIYNTPIIRNKGVTPRAQKPTMGWDAWRCFGTGCTDARIRAQAAVMLSHGMNTLGYTLFNPNAGCMFTGRSGGKLVENTTTFPTGVIGIANYLRSVGFNLAMYFTYGSPGCSAQTITNGYEDNDVAYMLGLGVTYLMYDCCVNTLGCPELQGLHRTMGQALLDAGADNIHYNVSGGIPVYMFDYGVPLWAQSTGADSWHAGQDQGTPLTYAKFLNLMDKMLLMQTEYPTASWWGVGFTAVLDLLGVGNGSMSDAEGRSNFSHACITSTQLWLSVDLTSATAGTFDTITNADAIAINQDPLLAVGTQYSTTPVGSGNILVWAKPMVDGKWAVALFNTDASANSISVKWSLFGGNGPYIVRDVWNKLELGVQSAGYTTPSTASHDVTLLTLTPYVENMNPPNFSPGNPGIITALQVVANSPPDMSVLVNNNGCVIQDVGGTPLPGNGVAQVALVPPGSNAYWAIIWYDIINNVYGVTYSASGTSPKIQLPDFIRQVPLAAILISAGTTTITNPMIADYRAPSLYNAQLHFNCLPFNATPYNIDCNGASDVLFNVYINGATTINLKNVRVGTKFSGVIANSGGATPTITFPNTTTPSGAVIQVSGKLPLDVTSSVFGSGITLGANATWYMSGWCQDNFGNYVIRFLLA